MSVQTEVERKNRRRGAERPRRATVPTATDEQIEERSEPEPVATRAMPRIVTVYRGAGAGELRHARCGRELIFVGVRGGIEVDFYCLSCREHITLTEAALARVPLGQG